MEWCCHFSLQCLKYHMSMLNNIIICFTEWNNTIVLYYFICENFHICSDMKTPGEERQHRTEKKRREWRIKKNHSPNSRFISSSSFCLFSQLFLSHTVCLSAYFKVCVGIVATLGPGKFVTLYACSHPAISVAALLYLVFSYFFLDLDFYFSPFFHIKTTSLKAYG